MSLELGYFLNPEYESSYPIAQAVQEQRHAVELAEQLGMTATFVGEHHSFTNFAWLPPMMLLSRLYDVAPKMTFGTAVLAGPLHRPAVLAEQAAFLDAATEGRFVLGLAAGWNAFEFQTMGEPLAGRGKRLDEIVGVLRALWESSEALDLPGPAYPYRGLSLGLRPFTKGGPPVWLGGSSRSALDRAARSGDAWIVSSHVSTETALEQVTTYRDCLTAAGLPKPSMRPSIRNIFVARTREEAVKRCGPYLTASYRMFDNWGLFSNVLAEPATTVDFEKAAGRALVGSVEDVAEELARFVSASDINLLLVRSQWLGIPHKWIEESMTLLCTEVIPKVDAAIPTDPRQEPGH